MLPDTKGPKPPKPPSPKRMAQLIAANASLLIAALVYMGWAYESAEYAYFHLNPLDLNVSIVEYMLYSLNLFSQILVVVAIVAIIVSAGWAAAARWQRSGSDAQHPMPHDDEPEEGKAEEEKQAERRNKNKKKNPYVIFGAVVTVVFIALFFAGIRWMNDSYVYLAAFGIGPLLFTWPYRSFDNGHFAYALALVVAAVCALWAGALYAQSQGTQEAHRIAQGFGTMPDVTVYSTQPLALAGPHVKAYPMPAGSPYHYRYEGLRLLTVRSGTYYIFPAHLGSGPETTYIIDDSSEVRIELY